MKRIINERLYDTDTAIFKGEPEGMGNIKFYMKKNGEIFKVIDDCYFLTYHSEHDLRNDLESSSMIDLYIERFGQVSE